MKQPSLLPICLGFALGLSLFATGGGLAYQEARQTVTLDVDGKITALTYWGKSTASDVLKTQGVPTASAQVVAPEDNLGDGDMVKVRYMKDIRVVADGEVVADKPMPASTYREVLKQAKVPVDDSSWTSFGDLDAQVPEAGDSVVVSSPKAIPVTVAGEQKMVVSNVPTVGAILRKADVNPGPADELNASLTSYVKPGDSLKLVEVEEKTTTREKKKKLQVKIKETDDLLAGTKEVKTAGRAEVIEETVVTTFADGKQRSAEVTDSKVVTKGIVRVVLKGTKVLEPEVIPDVDVPSNPGNGGGGSFTPTGSQAIAYKQIKARGWDDKQFKCLVTLWNRESGWNHRAENPGSGAYGIPQSLPGNKMASAGSDWRTNPATQIKWGLGYISDRYGNPCSALGHSDSVGWY